MRRKRFFLSKEKGEDEEVNLTPLIDVVFITLIAFILIAPMLEVDLVDLAEARTGKSAPMQESATIQIVVQKNNTVLLNNQLIELEKITESLSKQRHVMPGSALQLFHDREAAFGIYQTIKQAAENAGFEEIQVILKPS